MAVPRFLPCSLLADLTVGAELNAANPVQPNIVSILADDLGYDKMQSPIPGRSRIPTPQVDRLVPRRMTYTGVQPPSLVCTANRYDIETGRPSWRMRLQSNVRWGFDVPLIAQDGLPFRGGRVDTMVFSAADASDRRMMTDS